ncbi:MAG: proteinase inhibitor serpin, partial [Verrucomicrobiales bacterium]|nr:proteinase inhibitor serpin [Verrucomicrobiales bacterium]
MVPQHSRRWRVALFYSALFESVLVFLAFGAPRGSWLHAKIVWMHGPLLWLAERFHDELGRIDLEDAVMLVIPVIMVIFWAVAWRGLQFLFATIKQRIPPQHTRRFRWSLGLGLAIVLATAFSTLLPAGPKPFMKTQDVDSLVEGNTAFALAFYKQQPTNGNLSFSPYNVSSALGLTYAGAAKQTETEMASTLHFALPQETLHPAFGALQKRLNTVQRGSSIKLVTANALWLQQGYPFTQQFMEVARSHYDAETRALDFKGTANASSEINDWIGKKTQGKIGRMITPDQITANTKLILCSAIYFKGKWETQFAPSATRPRAFFLNEEKSIDVPMMSQKAEFKTYNDSQLHLIELPYVGRDLSMIILLPKHPDGLGDLEQQLSPAQLNEWLTKLEGSPSKETVVVLPRFKTTQTINLRQELGRLGMPSLFDPKQSNLSRMDS